jgi:hypothetical protein
MTVQEKQAVTEINAMHGAISQESTPLAFTKKV